MVAGRGKVAFFAALDDTTKWRYKDPDHQSIITYLWTTVEKTKHERLWSKRLATAARRVQDALVAKRSREGE